jgi:hypothetical protein
MLALIANPGITWNNETIARAAVQMADTLLGELKKNGCSHYDISTKAGEDVAGRPTIYTECNDCGVKLPRTKK